MRVNNKLQKLNSILDKIEDAVIAFSGGVDSALLLFAAGKVLTGRLVAATYDSPIIPRSEIVNAQKLAGLFRVKHVIIKDEMLLSNKDFVANRPDRCYICKKEIMGKIIEKASEYNISTIIDGSNAGDQKDFRPGMQASKEMGVLSPLQEAGLVKDEIRFLAREMGIPVWDKPASPCLCSRIPYGDEITRGKLDQIEKGEKMLKGLGFSEVRLRHHGNLVRLEIPLARMNDLFYPQTLNALKKELKALGFIYITLDLEGFRSGSFNEVS